MANSSHSSLANKSRNVSFRLTEAEYAQLAHSAAAADMRPNHLARKLVVSRSAQVSIKTHAACDPALVRQLYHIGHNLNQITKAVHLGRISPQIETLCQRIEAIMDEAAAGKDDV